MSIKADFCVIKLNIQTQKKLITDSVLNHRALYQQPTEEKSKASVRVQSKIKFYLYTHIHTHTEKLYEATKR